MKIQISTPGASGTSESFWLDLFKSLGGTTTILVVHGTTPTVVDTGSRDLCAVVGAVKAGTPYCDVPSASHPVTIFMPPGVLRTKAFEVLGWSDKDAILTAAVTASSVLGCTYDAATKRVSKTDLDQAVAGIDGFCLVASASTSPSPPADVVRLQRMVDVGTGWIEISPGLGDNNLSSVTMTWVSAPLCPNVLLDTEYMHLVGCGPGITTVTGYNCTAVIQRLAHHSLCAGFSVVNNCPNIADISMARGAILDGPIYRYETYVPLVLNSLGFDLLASQPFNDGSLRDIAGYSTCRSTLVECNFDGGDYGAAMSLLSGGTLVDCHMTGCVDGTALKGSPINLLWHGLILGGSYRTHNRSSAGRAFHGCGTQALDGIVTLVGVDVWAKTGCAFGDQPYCNYRWINCNVRQETGFFTKPYATAVTGFMYHIDGGTWIGNSANVLFDRNTAYDFTVYNSPSITNLGAGTVWPAGYTPTVGTGDCAIPEYALLPGVAEEIAGFKARDQAANRRAGRRIVNRFLADHLLDGWLRVPAA